MPYFLKKLEEMKQQYRILKMYGGKMFLRSACKDIKFPDGESIEAKWVGIDKFIEMEKNEEIVPSFEMNEQEFKRAVKLLNDKK